MKYMLLLYAEESAMPDTMTESDRAEFYADYNRWIGELRAQNVDVSSGRLRSVETATTVRNRNEKALITDGPFDGDKGGSRWLLLDRLRKP